MGGCMQITNFRQKQTTKTRTPVQVQPSQKYQKTSVSSANDGVSVIQICISDIEEQVSYKINSPELTQSRKTSILPNGLCKNHDKKFIEQNYYQQQFYFKNVLQVYGNKYPIDSDDLRKTQIITKQTSLSYKNINQSKIQKNPLEKTSLKRLSVISQVSQCSQKGTSNEKKKKVKNPQNSHHLYKYEKQRIPTKSFQRNTSILKANY